MTEKRYRVFKYNDNSGMWGVSDDKAKYTVAYFDNDLEAENLCKLLNALHEENVELKSALKELKEIGDYQADRIKELQEENEHIKNTIHDMIQTERTELGKSVLKQLQEGNTMKKEPLGAKPLDYHVDFTNCIEPIINVDDLTPQEEYLKKKLIEALEDLPKPKKGYLVRDIDE